MRKPKDGKQRGRRDGEEAKKKRKPVKNQSASFVSSSAASLLPHRFVTVRRGSPAAKSGQIRAGDRLEAVEGRSVVTLPHRELAQILRRAGNTLRLTIIPRPSTCKCAPKRSKRAPSDPSLNPRLPPPDTSSLSEPEYDTAHRSRKGQRLRPKVRMPWQPLAVGTAPPRLPLPCVPA